jgi:hypothetical protein
MVRSIKRDFLQAAMDHSMSGRPPSKRVFLSGTPFEPDRAGIKATMKVTHDPAFDIWSAKS